MNKLPTDDDIDELIKAEKMVQAILEKLPPERREGVLAIFCKHIAERLADGPNKP